MFVYLTKAPCLALELMRASSTNACDHEQEEEDRQREILEAQIARAQAEAAEAEDGPAEGTELKRDEDGQPLQIALAAPPKPAQHEAVAPLAQGFGRDDKGSKVCTPPTATTSKHTQALRSVAACIREAVQQALALRSNDWLMGLFLTLLLLKRQERGFVEMSPVIV